MALRIREPARPDRPAPLAGTRAQSLQRLQVGLSLLLGVVLIVGLANVIEQRAKQSGSAVVPEAAATIGPEPQSTASDPLVDAGVVPDLPDNPGTAASPTAAPRNAGQ